jgi:hypothetical protein
MGRINPRLNATSSTNPTLEEQRAYAESGLHRMTTQNAEERRNVQPAVFGVSEQLRLQLHGIAQRLGQR